MGCGNGAWLWAGCHVELLCFKIWYCTTGGKVHAWPDDENKICQSQNFGEQALLCSVCPPKISYRKGQHVQQICTAKNTCL